MFKTVTFLICALVITSHEDYLYKKSTYQEDYSTGRLPGGRTTSHEEKLTERIPYRPQKKTA